MDSQYTTIPEKDFSRGIDARSAENQIDPGFVRDMLNADIVEKRVRQRTGYQGYAGNVPVRVRGLEYRDTENQIVLTLDSSIDLGSVRSSPLVIYGRSSSISSGGPFTSAGDTAKYYSGFTVPLRKVMQETAGAPPFESIEIPEEEHGLGTTDMLIQVVESTSAISRSYSSALPHEVLIDGATKDISIEYQNSTGMDKDVFVFYRDNQLVVGETYIATLSHTGSGAESFVIPAATHALTNFNISGMIQADQTTEVAFVQPNRFILAPSGDIGITIEAATPGTYYALLTINPIANQATANVAGNSTGSIVISAVSSPWIFPAIYMELTPGGQKEQVIPDSVSYDDSTQEYTISFTNSRSSARQFVVYWNYGTTRSNQLAVTDATVTADAEDDRPQMTIWGLDHAEIYGEAAGTRAGWGNHVDSYRSPTQQRMVTGLGGNLFSSRTVGEAGTEYLYPQLHALLRSRTDSDITIGPVFYGTGDTPARTRGYVTGDDSGTNWATITAVSWDSGNSWVKYTLSVPGMQILDSAGSPTTIGNVISTSAGLEDWFSAQDMSFSRHNGVFRIRQVQSSSETIEVWVENDQVDSSDWDDSGLGGEGGIFSDQITWLSGTYYIPGDTLVNPALSEEVATTVLSSQEMVSVVSVYNLIQIAAGLTTVGQRTSSVIPMRSSQPAATASTDNLVRGDMLSYAPIERLLRVLYIYPSSLESVDISGDGTSATVTLTSTASLAAGQKVLIANARGYSGVQTINEVLSETEFSFSSEYDYSVTSASLIGETVEVDEELDWGDSTDDSLLFQVDERWIPIEAPDDSYSLTPATYIQHFDSEDYDSQPFLRSTMVQNDMYLTDSLDEVMKYDGTNIYRAGLIPWQPGLFLTIDTAATARIVVDNPSSTPSAVVSNVFTVSIGEESLFPAGSRIRHSYTGGYTDYTVLSTYDDGTDGFVKVQRTSTSSITLGASPALTLLSVRRYYFRLNAVDANNNIIASAVTGYQDHVVELAEDAAVSLRLVGMPAWGIYDYDRLEVEIYATKLNTVAPFYRLTTLQMPFNEADGYINYQDSFSDADLLELDAVSSGLKGQELGVQWNEPLRAKYIASLGNSLVLGNLRDYPQLDLQLVASGAVTNTTYAGKIFTFRKDSTDIGTTTNMVDRVRYELRSVADSVSVSAATGSAGTSFTVTVNNTAAAGDWVYLHWSTVADTGRSLQYAGWWQIDSATATDITILYPGAEAGTITSDVPDSALFATDPTDIPVPLGTDGNMGMVNGDSFDLFDVGRRLSMAINASMRMTTTPGFTPWMISRGGNDTGRSGRVLIRQPRTSEVTLELELPSSFSGGGQSFEVFVNEVRRSPSQQVSAVSRLYPSRIAISYENYPEIFDNLTAVLDSESDSVIDINSADGQEITGILPFFGESAFGAAQQSAILVVFKSNSIYLVDVNEKRAGRNPLQRIETQGVGCTAPYSIAVTKNGIIFANESGIYCLRRDQAIDYIGKYMERNWTERVNLDQLDLVQGHHYGTGRVYKLSVPLSGEDSNSEVYVYNHTEENATGLGPWTRYDSHPATGWANLNSDAFFSSTNGRVFSLRRTGLESDYRDDSGAIQFRLDTRAIDFDNPNIRKVLDKCLINYRTGARNTDTTVSYSVDLSRTFEETTSIIIPYPTETTGIDDQSGQDIVEVAHSLGKRRGVYFSIRVENGAIDQNIEIAGMGFRVKGLETKGILQAVQTQSK